MYALITKIGALAVASLATQAVAVPSNSKPDPFSNASWPLPHNISGVSNPGANESYQGWGGVHLHDPSIVMGPDGHFYSFSTHGLVVISRASQPNSLDGYWEPIGSVLESSSIINNTGNTDPWAPDVHKVGDTYYCYYAVSQFGSQFSSIGLATSKTLRPGSWVDHGAVLTSNTTAPSPLNITNAIDANLFIDPKTKIPYLTYGSFWSDIWQFQLAKDLLSVVWTPAPVQLSLDPVSPQAEEGAYLSRHDSWYYLWYSHGSCCGYNVSALPAPGQEYSIRVGRSRSATGPFVDRNGVDLRNGGGYIIYGSHDYVYGPGGQAVLTNYHGRDVLYYHYVNTIQNPTYVDELKLLGWNYINYIQGWPVLSYD
ncbi:endo-1,5-alpha-L-arabinosidase [Aureobasidium pullulans]|uniref:Arabinan endo-1,5-alpha-L-arabinosidase n=1 Tax=Aureobasidium pullulans TaxID=5580 RepID=A0A4T0C4B6_AURPU|nr:endo-1,5-alpha-L-arabinosidase [Aureobasidium pullulans]